MFGIPISKVFRIFENGNVNDDCTICSFVLLLFIKVRSDIKRNNVYIETKKFKFLIACGVSTPLCTMPLTRLCIVCIKFSKFFILTDEDFENHFFH